MGLTKRQEEMISQMVIAESRAAAESQQERHRILDGIDGEDDLLEEAPQHTELTTAIRHAVIDLVEAFYTDNRLYEGVEVDNGRAAKLATQYLYRLVEADVKETMDMLQSGDFDGMDEESMPSMSGGGGGGSSPPPSGMDQHGGVLDADDLPPMHPRASGKPGGVTGGTGRVTVGAPEKHGHSHRGSSMLDPESGEWAKTGTSDEPPRGYGHGGEEDVVLPPMHPRGRR